MNEPSDKNGEAIRGLEHLLAAWGNNQLYMDARTHVFRALQVLRAPRSADVEREGHGAPCYYCTEPCDSLSCNPSRWPIALCHRDDPGRVKWHHTGCVAERLIENQPATSSERSTVPDPGGDLEILRMALGN